MQSIEQHYYRGYWNSQTLDRITDHANKFYKEKLNGNNHPLTINNFPRTLQIYDADINIAFNLEKQGKLLLQKLITDNTKDNTGFLMWISNYCFSCIFQHNNMKTKAKSLEYYIIRFSPHGTFDIFEKMNYIDFLIQSLVNIVKKKQFQSKDVEYFIKFAPYSTDLSNAARQKVMAKHKSHSQKELQAKRRKESYAQMEPAMKKRVSPDKAIWYKSLDPAEKEKLLSHRAEWYKSLDPEEKEKLLSKSTDWYKSLGSAEKQDLLSSRAISYKSLDTAQKQKRAELFNLLNSAQKQKKSRMV